MSFLKSILFHLAFTFLLTGICYLFDISFPDLLHPKYWVILSFYGFVGLLVYGLVRIGHKLEGQMPVMVLGGVVLRLLLIVFFMVFSMVFEVNDASKFVVNTAVIYLPYLIFEIILLLPNLRPNSEKN